MESYGTSAKSHVVIFDLGLCGCLLFDLPSRISLKFSAPQNTFYSSENKIQTLVKQCIEGTVKAVFLGLNSSDRNHDGAENILNAAAVRVYIVNEN